MSRRHALKVLGSAVAGGAMIVAGEGAAGTVLCRQAGATCLKDAQCCSGACDPGTHRCTCLEAQAPCGPRCCAAGQVCADAAHGACCTPQDLAALCAGSCDTDVPNNCGQRVH